MSIHISYTRGGGGGGGGGGTIHVPAHIYTTCVATRIRRLCASLNLYSVQTWTKYWGGGGGGNYAYGKMSGMGGRRGDNNSGEETFFPRHQCQGGIFFSGGQPGLRHRLQLHIIAARHVMMRMDSNLLQFVTLNLGIIVHMCAFFSAIISFSNACARMHWTL